MAGCTSGRSRAIALPGADGYVTELPYTLGYYPELDPRHIGARLSSFGLQPPRFARACELGFGQGLSLAVHAVAGDAAWWGNDLLPQHVATVRSLTQGLTDRLHVMESSFETFCADSSLPSFDLIVLHGVWSWISEANRRRILNFVEQRLAPQGVLYLSYNVREGWGSMLALREFLVQYAARDELARLSLAERIETALIAAQQVVAKDLPPARDNPQFERHLRAIRHQSKSYLAHEYFNRDWHVFDPADIALALSPLGLRYAGQATATESVRDRASTNAPEKIRFRRDLFVRGLSSGPSPTLPVSSATDKFQRVWRFNDRLLNLAKTEPFLSTLASPQTGAGVEVGWRGLLALGAWRAGCRDAQSIVAQVTSALTAIQHPYVHRDVVIRDPGEIRLLLTREAEQFVHERLPWLQQLGVEC